MLHSLLGGVIYGIVFLIYIPYNLCSNTLYYISYVRLYHVASHSSAC